MPFSLISPLLLFETRPEDRTTAMTVDEALAEPTATASTPAPKEAGCCCCLLLLLPPLLFLLLLVQLLLLLLSRWPLADGAGAADAAAAARWRSHRMLEVWMCGNLEANLVSC